MFGYITPDKPDLRVRELDAYRAVYCSLCYSLRQYGFGAKLALNYDFTFSAMLHLALGDDAPEFYDGRCNTNPLQKERLMRQAPALRYSAAALLLTVHYKLVDDRKDGSFFRRIGAFIASVFLSGAYKRARTQLPDADAFISAQMDAQFVLEHDLCAGVDRACHPTAVGLAYVFENMSADAPTRRVLSRLGYLIGRFVYLADAADDLRGDLKRGRYNVFIIKNGLKKEDDVSSSIEEAKGHMRLTSAEAERCYRLLRLRHFIPVLDNIIYRGMPAAIDRIGSQKKEGNRNHD